MMEDTPLHFKDRFKQLRDTYVVNQAQQAKLPQFAPDRLRRYRIIFSGRVQKVGFRLEVSELARRLGLTGFCQNLENGDVLAELQGPDNKIQYLISFMESLKRIKIRNKVMTELSPDIGEIAFVQK